MPTEGQSIWRHLAWHRRHAMADAAAGDRSALGRWLLAVAALFGWIASASMMAALFIAGLAFEADRGSMLWGLAALVLVGCMFPWGLAREARAMLISQLRRDPVHMERCARRDGLFQALDQAEEISSAVAPPRAESKRPRWL